MDGGRANAGIRRTGTGRHDRRRGRAARDTQDLVRAIGTEVRRQREDAGLSQRRLARAAGIDQAHLSRIEAGGIEAGVRVLDALAHALGGRLRVRIEPGMGPAIRDHLQSAMVEALLRSINPRWARFPEVAVHRPVRGFIDLVLADRDANLLVAIEVHSQIRRLEQQLRWANEKAEALRDLPQLAPAGPAGVAPTTSKLLVLRSTQATRAIVDGHRHLLAPVYPAQQAEIMAALTGHAPWPGAGIVWMAIEEVGLESWTDGADAGPCREVKLESWTDDEARC
jgi:transcriptional regulator with XRE-family HTH domain